MSTDPVLRLVALHSSDLRDAEEILFPQGRGDFEGDIDPIEDAVSAFIDTVEEGICAGVDEVRLDLQIAEFLALALKQRKQARGHPPLTRRQAALRKATVSFAERRAQQLCRGGLGIGEARRQAADEVSVRAFQSGDRIAPSTLVKLMKVEATRLKARRTKV